MLLGVPIEEYNISMNIKIRSVDFELTAAIEEYVNKKVSSLDKFLDSPESTICEVEIGRSTKRHKSGDVYRAEVNMTGPGNNQVYAVAEESDLYAAIDIVRDEAEREIVSRKSKYKTLIRKGSAQVKNLLKRINFKRS